MNAERWVSGVDVSQTEKAKRFVEKKKKIFLSPAVPLMAITNGIMIYLRVTSKSTWRKAKEKFVDRRFSDKVSKQLYGLKVATALLGGSCSLVDETKNHTATFLSLRSRQSFLHGRMSTNDFGNDSRLETCALVRFEILRRHFWHVNKLVGENVELDRSNVNFSRQGSAAGNRSENERFVQRIERARRISDTVERNERR